MLRAYLPARDGGRAVNLQPVSTASRLSRNGTCGASGRNSVDDLAVAQKTSTPVTKPDRRQRHRQLGSQPCSARWLTHHYYARLSGRDARRPRHLELSRQSGCPCRSLKTGAGRLPEPSPAPAPARTQVFRGLRRLAGDGGGAEGCVPDGLRPSTPGSTTPSRPSTAGSTGAPDDWAAGNRTAVTANHRLWRLAIWSESAVRPHGSRPGASAHRRARRGNQLRRHPPEHRTARTARRPADRTGRSSAPSGGHHGFEPAPG